MKAKHRGFITGYRSPEGLFISSVSPHSKEAEAPPAYLRFAAETIAASTFRYADETEVPDDVPLGSGLQVNMPNGDVLLIAETRDKK